VASQLLSGHLLTLVSMLVIATRCCLTCLSKGTSPTNEQAKRYTALDTLDLILEEMVALNYVHTMYHLMVIKAALQMQITLVIVSQKIKMARTC
jgi:hypothetical protein